MAKLRPDIENAPWRRRAATDDADRQTRSLAGLAVTLAVLVACLFLVNQLRHKSAVEDCLMAGGRNCDAMLLQR